MSTYSWQRNCGHEERLSEKEEEDLLVFGYSCKIFNDEKKARFLDQGKHLIPWMGSENLLIDRFDVRGYLQDLNLYEAKGIDSKEIAEELSSEELQLEQQCDEERFRDLKLDDAYHEEEMKRLKAALALDGPYHEIEFKYDSVVEPETKPEEPPEAPDESVTDPYITPSGLPLPSGIELPRTMKQHNLMEKTAKFISTHGAQMEILIKTKQAANSQFDFLAFDSPLNPYYKHLVAMIKTGKYRAKSEEKETDSSYDSNESDSDGDSYLHPSLLGSRNNKSSPAKPLVLPNLPRSENDSYAQLVKSLRGKIAMETEEEADEEMDPKESTNFSQSKFSDSCDQGAAVPPVGLHSSPPTPSTPTWPSLLPTPPPEIEMIIEKLAQYVAKNGEEFESTVRKRGEERFEFLNPGNKYHAHYIRRKLQYLEDKRKSQAAELKMKSSNEADREKLESKAPVSFCFNVREKKGTPSSEEKPAKSETTKASLESDSKKNEAALADKLAVAARERLSREKMLQEERKRKAALFLSMVKTKELNQAKPEVRDEEKDEDKSKTKVEIGPVLPTEDAPPSVDAEATIPEPSHTPPSGEIVKVKNGEVSKLCSVLPFVAKDEPLKESSRNSYSRENNHDTRRHRHHRHHHRHHHHRHKYRSRSRSRSGSRSRCSRSSSRSRTRSSSRSKSRKTRRRSRSRSRTSK